MSAETKYLASGVRIVPVGGNWCILRVPYGFLMADGSVDDSLPAREELYMNFESVEAAEEYITNVGLPLAMFPDFSHLQEAVCSKNS